MLDNCLSDPWLEYYLSTCKNKCYRGSISIPFTHHAYKKGTFQGLLKYIQYFNLRKIQWLTYKRMKKASTLKVCSSLALRALILIQANTLLEKGLDQRNKLGYEHTNYLRSGWKCVNVLCPRMDGDQILLGYKEIAYITKLLFHN